jgi:hypothetical protein
VVPKLLPLLKKRSRALHTESPKALHMVNPKAKITEKQKALLTTIEARRQSLSQRNAIILSSHPTVTITSVSIQ